MKKALFLLAVIAGFVLTACGGGGGASTTINVTMTDFQFTPNTFTVPAGQQITIKAVNNGGVVHNFVVMKEGMDAGEAWDDSDVPNVYWQIQLEPGDSKTDTFTAPPDPGTYQVVCSTPGHIMAGMVAKLNVVADGQ